MDDTATKMRIVVLEKPDIAAKLKEVADDKGMTQAALIRQLIRVAILEHTEKIVANPQTN